MKLNAIGMEAVGYIKPDVLGQGRKSLDRNALNCEFAQKLTQTLSPGQIQELTNKETLARLDILRETAFFTMDEGKYKAINSIRSAIQTFKQNISNPKAIAQQASSQKAVAEKATANIPRENIFNKSEEKHITSPIVKGVNPFAAKKLNSGTRNADIASVNFTQEHIFKGTKGSFASNANNSNNIPVFIV